MRQADYCDVCRAPASRELLGAFMRHVGGGSYRVYVECRNQRTCWERRDAQQADRATAGPERRGPAA